MEGDRRWLLTGALGCAALSLAFSIPLIRLDLNIYDEGLIALGAEQVLKGQWPLVDFYAPYPPGAFFALAALYRIFGVSLLTERGLSVGLVALGMALAFLLVASQGLQRWRLVVAVAAVGIAGLCLSALWVTPQVGGALALLLLAANVLVRKLSVGSTLGAASTGLILGLAALWRADLALYGAIAAWVTWLLLAPGPTFRQRLKGGMAMAAGAAAVALPVFGLFVFLGGQRAFDALFVWPITGTYHATLPWPTLLTGEDVRYARTLSTLSAVPRVLRYWPYYFPFVAFVAVLSQLARRKGRVGPAAAARAWLSLLGVGLGIYALGRSDYTHVFPLLLVGVTMAALFVTTELSERGLRRVGAAVVAISTLALIPSPLEAFFEKRSGVRVPVPFPRAQGLSADPAMLTRYASLVAALNDAEHASPTYSGTSRHDVFMANDVMLYFLSERDPGTYYWCLDASVTTSAAVQLQMIRELNARGVHRVVLWNGALVPDARATAGSHELDQMLAETFGSPVQVGAFFVLERLRP